MIAPALAPVQHRLNLVALDQMPAQIERPRVDPRALKTGIVHLGVGAFQRAHQAVYTEDAIAAEGGDWGIIGVSLRRPDAAEKLCAQDCLYAVETRSDASRYRIIGALRDVLTAPRQPEAVFTALASTSTRVVTLTVTEKGYSLGADGALDPQDADIAHDLQNPAVPRSTLGWLLRGLSQRFRTHRQPLTVVSCDNISANSQKLRGALLQFARVVEPDMASWIEDAIRFPNAMVDCVVPATDTAALARAEAALGVRDDAIVQREAFSQWVIEDDFAGPRPAWDAAGAEIVRDVAPYERMKLHVLNASHSALAYLGIPKGHTYVRQAIADPELSALLDDMVEREIAPALSPLPIDTYWRETKKRFANPSIDHALAQIAQDGSKKLAVRLFPLLIENARADEPTRRMAHVIRAWLAFTRTHVPVIDPQADRLAQWARAGGDITRALDDVHLFPEPFRTDPKVRTALTGAS